MTWAGLPDRIADKIAPEPNSGCWLWDARWSAGYGRIIVGGANRLAHRIVYEAIRGPIPDGLHLDHLCRIRCCVNPDHLEPVTQHENNRRSGAWTWRARLTRCKRGHPLSAPNLAKHRSGAKTPRVCLACVRIHNAIQRAKRRASL